MQQERGAQTPKNQTRASQTPRPGRPPACSPEERRDALIRAAKKVFLRDGFAGATMEKIAAEAEMSKRTLYRFFPDKRSALDALLGAHDHRPPLAPYQHRPGDDPRDEIRRCLVALVDYLLDPVQIGLTRLVIAEAPLYPDIASSFEGLEIGGVVEHVAERFRRLAADGAISAANPEELADLMIGSLMNPWQVIALASPGRQLPGRAEILSRVEKVLDVFSVRFGL